MVHANFNEHTNLNDTQHANLAEVVIKYVVVVRTSSFDRDKYQVKNIVLKFYETVINKIRLKSHRFDVVEVCKMTKSLLPIRKGSYITKRYKTVILIHSNMIDHSTMDIDITEDIRAKSIDKFDRIKVRVYSHLTKF